MHGLKAPSWLRRAGASAAAMATMVVMVPAAPVSAAPVTTATTEAIPPGASSGVLSDDGNRIAYLDFGGDLQLRDRAANTTSTVSLAANGGRASAVSSGPSISGDGSLVAWHSTASNLVAPPYTSGGEQVYVRDIAAGRTELVSLTANQAPFPFARWAQLSSDGRRIVFEAGGPGEGLQHVYVRDLVAGATFQVDVGPNGPANASAAFPAVNGDGTVIAFVSSATNLDPAATDNQLHVYLADLRSGTVTVVDVGDSPDALGWWAPPLTVSRDGSHVAWMSHAGSAWRFDARAHVREPISARSDGTIVQGQPARLSQDGRMALFTSYDSDLVGGDTNGTEDAFVRDMVNGYIERASVTAAGDQMSIGHSWDMSPDARFVTFQGASGMYLRDRGGADRVAVVLSGGVSGGATGRLRTGDFTVKTDFYGVVSAVGAGTLAGAGGANAAVQVDLRRFWVLPMYLGSCSMVDPGSGLQAKGFALFASVAKDLDGSVHTHLFGFTPWPWRAFNMGVTIWDEH